MYVYMHTSGPVENSLSLATEIYRHTQDNHKNEFAVLFLFNFVLNSPGHFHPDLGKNVLF